MPFLVHSGKLSVIEAVCVELCIRTELVVGASKGMLKAEESIATQLADFLDPVNGNFQKQGFGVGWIPDKKTIEYFLYMIEGVKRIDLLQIRGFTLHKGKWTEIDLLSFTKKQFAVIKSGRHHVRCSQQV